MSVYLIGIHVVRDYDTWRRVFDYRVEARKAAGCLGGTTYRENNGSTQRAIALL